MKRDLAILVLATLVAAVAILAYPPRRGWSRPCAVDGVDYVIEFHVVATARSSIGGVVLYGPWEPVDAWPRWGWATRGTLPRDVARLAVRQLGSSPAHTLLTLDPSLPPWFVTAVAWPFVVAEFSVVVLAFGLGLTWTLRRDRRRRALAPA